MRLLFGPWLGELGIELMFWQAYGRWLAQSEDWDQVIVACKSGHEMLYADFADDIVTVDGGSIDAAGSINASDEAKTCGDILLDHKIPGDVIVTPDISSIKSWRAQKDKILRGSQKFIDLSGPQTNGGPDVLLHARSIVGENAKDDERKNWSTSKWENLVVRLGEVGYSCASIGHKDGADHIKGTIDFRRDGLEQLAMDVSSAKLVVGPSSGPIHFSVLCKTNVVTWGTANVGNYYYMNDKLNPFGVDIGFLPVAHGSEEDWNPATIDVFERCESLLKLTRDKHREQPSLVVLGTKRSGHHAVIDWICRNTDKTTLYGNDCKIADRKLVPRLTHRGGKDSYNPVKIYPNGDNVIDIKRSVYSIEDHLPPAEIERRLNVHNISPNMIVSVLRDPYNNVASLSRGIGKFNTLPFISPQWKSMVKLYEAQLYAASDEGGPLHWKTNNVVYVSYNKWHADPTYRTNVLDKLGLTTIDNSLGSVSKYGGGSSFDMTYDPYQLKVDARWEEYMSDRNYRALFTPKIQQLIYNFHGMKCPWASS